MVISSTATGVEKQSAAEPGIKDSLPKSKGEKLFDLLVYGGISFAGVFLATLPFAHSVKYGKGKKIHESSMNALKKMGFSEHASDAIFNTTVLGMIGNVAVVPIKMLEDNKAQHVATLDKMLGEEPCADLKHIESEPKQTWGSLVKSRVVSYAVVWASLQGAVSAFGPKKFGEFEEKFAEKMCEVIKKPTHVMAEIEGAGLQKVESKAFQYGKIAALDVFATAAATALLYIGSRFFAKKKQETVRQEPVATSIASPAETPAAPDTAPRPQKLFVDGAHKAPRAMHQRAAGFSEAVAEQKAARAEAAQFLQA